MTTTFETAKVGDRVWSLQFGWGIIINTRYDFIYPILVKFSGGDFSFTADGRENLDMPRLLFWDEVEIEAPTKPLPDKEWLFDNGHASNCEVSRNAK